MYHKPALHRTRRANFTSALRSALREDPDIILVSEMRDLRNHRDYFSSDSNNHLVLLPLHTLDAKETINRVIAMFPVEEQNRIRV